MQQRQDWWPWRFSNLAVVITRSSDFEIAASEMFGPLAGLPCEHPHPDLPSAPIDPFEDRIPCHLPAEVSGLSPMTHPERACVELDLGIVPWT